MWSILTTLLKEMSEGRKVEVSWGWGEQFRNPGVGNTLSSGLTPNLARTVEHSLPSDSSFKALILPNRKLNLGLFFLQHQ